MYILARRITAKAKGSIIVAMDKLVIAGGCFWGMEELFRQQSGVIDTEVGYAGGTNGRPTYEFHPGHAESLEVSFDSKATTIDRLLDYFFNIHDPTTIDRQGNDVGEAYRSAIFYRNQDQLKAGELAIKRAGLVWSQPVVTKLEPLDKFWPAEDYHQDYLQKQPGGYTCHYERG